MGSGEIVQRLGVSRTRVYALAQRDDFPAPLDELAGGRVWRATDVEAWIRVNRPHLAQHGKTSPPETAGRAVREE